MLVRTLIAALVASLAVAATAAAATPATYRAKVNRVCRTYTPQLKSTAAAATKARTAGNTAVYGTSLLRLLGLALEQDHGIEAVKPPAALHTTMAPILSRLHAIDTHLTAAIQRTQNGDVAGLATELQAVSTLGAPLNKRFVAAGLPSCSSATQ